MPDEDKGLHPLRIMVPTEIYEKLEAQKEDEGYTTLQSFIAPILCAVGRGEIRRSYHSTSPAIQTKAVGI
ncbi:hypothetical protein EU556_13795 [Hymenobacter fodinae]|uniref:Uncharacterized protein n=1 Tax=Hymenobacter fodinae TaxID=2510796 RepID=A0A4Z0P8M6_9BACT|nr:hypothetical protein EU556_13795 [Hymenobacter fodinae]